MLGKTKKICSNSYGSLHATEAAYFNQPYRYYTLVMAPKLWRAFHILKTKLDIPNVQIILKPMNAKGAHGNYWHPARRVIMDPRGMAKIGQRRLTVSLVTEIISTLAHELVHAEQYHQGRLTLDDKWMGKEVPKNTRYRNKPWEQEAYRREVILTAEVIAEVGEEFLRSGL